MAPHERALLEPNVGELCRVELAVLVERGLGCRDAEVGPAEVDLAPLVSTALVGDRRGQAPEVDASLVRVRVEPCERTAGDQPSNNLLGERRA